MWDMIEMQTQLIIVEQRYITLVDSAIFLIPTVHSSTVFWIPVTYISHYFSPVLLIIVRNLVIAPQQLILIPVFSLVIAPHQFSFKYLELEGLKIFGIWGEAGLDGEGLTLDGGGGGVVWGGVVWVPSEYYV